MKTSANLKTVIVCSGIVATLAACASAQTKIQTTGSTNVIRDIATGPFQPTWNSLTNYQTPEWFRDAKFGIWAHWGPQCEPEEGDWYARNMYIPGQTVFATHLEKYGHPSTNGFKDIIHQWKATEFDPDKLLAFYKENGAKYFMALSSHHDNFDNFNSKYQPWNSVNVGPHKDLIGGWAAAARKNGLRFAVSIHSARAWSWYEVAQGAGTNGPLAGVPYDGKLTKADGKGLWWDGLDPQDLYAQNHPVGERLVWNPDSAQGSNAAETAYIEKFFKRTKQVWDDYQPDMIYFDDGVLPMHGVSDEIGLNLAAHFYNSSIQLHGRNEAVLNCKDLNDLQREAMVYDIERGRASGILPLPWQTDTCIGSWHYKLERLEKHLYVPASTIIPMLADIVSKNGNLMLSVPLNRDGVPDSDEIKIVTDIGAWLKVNGDAIYATRPWKTFGEGPSTTADVSARGGRPAAVASKPYTPEDIRFTQSKDGKTLYAIVLAIPADGKITIKSLSGDSPNWTGKIGSVRLLGVSGDLKFTRDEKGLHVTLPETVPSKFAVALQIQS
jgi:alpha-L-fucosidase